MNEERQGVIQILFMRDDRLFVLGGGRVEILTVIRPTNVAGGDTAAAERGLREERRVAPSTHNVWGPHHCLRRTPVPPSVHAAHETTDHGTIPGHQAHRGDQ